jgi:hypothetical protein
LSLGAGVEAAPYSVESGGATIGAGYAGDFAAELGDGGGLTVGAEPGFAGGRGGVGARAFRGCRGSPGSRQLAARLFGRGAGLAKVGVQGGDICDGRGEEDGGESRGDE